MATDANPGMAVTRKNSNWRGGGPRPPVTVLPDSTELVHSDRGDIVGAAPLYEDIDVVRGPVAEILLQPGPRTRLVVRASHIVTDGRGLQHWLADVFRVLRGTDPVGSPATVNDTHFLAAAGKVAPVAGTGKIPTQPTMLGSGPASGRPLWVRRTVPAAPKGVTARIAAAVSGRLPAECGHVLVPVDLRRHDRSIDSTANLTAQLLVPVERGGDWRRIHSRLLTGLLRKHEVAQQLGRDFRNTNPFVNSLTEAAQYTGDAFPAAAIISDHGPFDLTRYAAPTFAPDTIYTLPMLVPYVEMFVSAFQLDDRTELTVGARERPGAVEAARALLDDTAALLLSD
ncbi:hypothetical protein EV186_104464 [Labedaea rhizosphaerae]|uniref:Condensation domain-containing protein n=1 Tax=Labedaea rhizosphaerae TaxID=598644 RepID=A0A4R6SBT3_LABRH|nr:hypothetical protein EV186_104464 [Labedaea rhizosphaerae]